MHREIIKSEVLDASKKWVTSFNQGDVKTCSDTYTTDAVMVVRPTMGKFEGRRAINDFWSGFIHSTNATDMNYDKIDISVVDEHSAILSAKWSMNVGRGFITKELWVKAGDTWLLAEDDFTIEEQF